MNDLNWHIKKYNSYSLHKPVEKALDPTCWKNLRWYFAASMNPQNRITEINPMDRIREIIKNETD